MLKSAAIAIQHGENPTCLATIQINGVVCGCCGSHELRVVALTADTAHGWCCVGHAARAGWPWLEAEQPVKRRMVSP
jgi:hypothetical protein